MIGAIAGDIIGSMREQIPIKTKDFELFPHGSRFTDDTVATVALAESIMTNENYIDTLHRYYQKYPQGWGVAFREWAKNKRREPYNSWGNGSAMRVSAIGHAYDSITEVLSQAEKSAMITHNHPEGIKGAQATALAILLSRKRWSKESIKNYIETIFDYDLSRTSDEIRPGYQFETSCQETVPQAIISFLDSNDFEDAIRIAISLGGDSDTLACITGSIAEAYYDGVPVPIIQKTISYLDEPLIKTIEKFSSYLYVKKWV